MSYQALYRRFRPRRFLDVKGQDHITTILKNQVVSGRYAHAYLFSGSRGTGKTSIARIFARAVNCLSPADGEPCGVCEACRHSLEEDAVDIIEIDAASNTGVDDMRALLEKVRFTPLQLRYKVYIIDEVHMLSNAASNALLKTLEEPPAHVLFLLATTEPQKILPTVISRCQRFDFHRLALSDMVGVLQGVLAEAGAVIEEGGLLAIARAADGGMRDALSLADQCLAFCGGHVSEKDVYDVLGSMQQDFLFDMADALIKGDAARALTQFDALVRSGRDMGVFAQDLAQHLRALLLAKACGDCRELLDCTAETMARYRAQAEAASQERLLRALELITKSQSEMKWLRQPRVLLEAMLVRICRPEDEGALIALQERIAQLEAKLNAAPAAAQQPVSPAPAAPQPVRPQSAPQAPRDAPPWETEDLIPPPEEPAFYADEPADEPMNEPVKEKAPARAAPARPAS
ncbi:MAG TPA: DNA polymerase III subunit gamma/tau, partial [Feifaniaceae bacterium]|nr:DNA polymerase III subunit gamma/tau [Feifaniaceae bacterium]